MIVSTTKMTSSVQELNVVCKWYEDLIGLCNDQINTIRNCNDTRPIFSKRGDSTDETEDDSDNTINIDSSSLNKTRVQELSKVILRCSDADFLEVLRSELERQRDFHQKRIQQLLKLQIKVNVTPAAAPLQSYFRMPTSDANDGLVLKYYHFDGDSIAREIHVDTNQSVILLIAGRDDSKMCHFKLSPARELLQLSEKTVVSEAEFNCLWSQHGGLPFVRSTRLARRNLMSALSKLNRV
ncbi:Myosin heavy chain 95F [Orchesella cincta]|uniref:Myosin heavy chain 95F n=1 Tax=Orchesella cincta TaxID=48709 RepID=A0A1D2MHL7_ORCCI|nr:Myosin heavy chain 95F [Orchesella cincta]